MRREMVLEIRFTQTEMFTKDNSSDSYTMERVSTLTRMETGMKETSRKD